MKLIIVLPNLGVGGAERALISLANYWSRNDMFAVTIALMRKEGALLKLIDPSIRVLTLCPLKSGPFIFSAFYSFVRLFFLMRERSPSIILSTLVGTNVIVAAAHYLSISKCRLVLREACATSDFDFSIKRWLSKLLYRRADAIVAVSEGVSRELIEIHGISQKKITLINNPIDIAYIQHRASTALPSLSLPSDRPTVMAVGRLVRQKGFDVLIDAFHEVVRYRKCNLVIVGDGIERENLQQQVSSLNLNRSVILTGTQDNPYIFLKHADLLVSSSRWEGFPNVILEAMALGRPIIATKCPGILGSTLEQSSLISLVDTDDPLGLAEAISKKLRNPLGSCDYTDYLKEFDINCVARRYADLLLNDRTLSNTKANNPLA